MLQILPIFVLLLGSMAYRTTRFDGGFLVTRSPTTKLMLISNSCHPQRMDETFDRCDIASAACRRLIYSRDVV